MDIFIPSKGRANVVRTLNQIPAHLKPKVVVYPDEADRYRFYIRDRAEVVTCDCEKGITHKRNWIGRNAGSKFVMLDDDLKFFVREQEGGKKLRDATRGDIEQMFADLEDCLMNFGHVGIIDRVASSMIKPEEMVFGNLQKNTRMMRVLGYRKEIWELAEHGRIPLMEDFDVTLQLIRRGWPNAVLSWWAQDQGSTQASGGCSTYRTHELHEQSAKLLAELHEPFVKLRQKENKTGGAFGHRTEVTIQWKKAAEAGRFYPDTPPRS